MALLRMDKCTPSVGQMKGKVKMSSSSATSITTAKLRKLEERGLVAGDHHTQSFMLKARKTANKDIEGILSNRLDTMDHLSQGLA